MNIAKTGNSAFFCGEQQIPRCSVKICKLRTTAGPYGDEMIVMMMMTTTTTMSVMTVVIMAVTMMTVATANDEDDIGISVQLKASHGVVFTIQVSITTRQR